jgi:hypothetical protein
MPRISLAAGLTAVALALATAPLLAQPGIRGGGPPFCQNGQGHPVHGWSWCVSHGFAPTWSGPAFLRGWDGVRWDDARFRDRRPARQGGWYGQADLVAILGEVLLGRLIDEGRGRGPAQPIQARWVQQGFDGLALEVRAGDVPIAYLHDATRDGRVDRVYLRPRR